MKNSKNTICVEYSNGKVFHNVVEGANIDAAMRKVKDANDKVILFKSGRKNAEQFAGLCAKSDTIVHCITKNGDSIYEGADTVPAPKKTPAPAPAKEQPKPVQAKEQPKPAEPVVHINEAIPSVPSVPAMPVDAGNPFSMFAEYLKPYIKQSEINQEQINGFIDNKLAKHSKVIIVDNKQTGVKKNLGIQHYNFEHLLHFAKNRINVQLTGAAGSGKTKGAEIAAEALGLNFYSISVGAMTTKTDFQGYLDARGAYVLTLFRTAYELGGLFLLDEMDAGNANVLTTINMALGSDVASFPDGMINRHKDFVLVAATNTYGNGADRMYVGRNQLDGASIDRFVLLDWDYDENIEDAITSNRRWTRYVQACRKNLFAAKIRFIISPRASIFGGTMLDDGMNIDMVKSSCLFKSLTKEQITVVTKGVTY